MNTAMISVTGEDEPLIFSLKSPLIRSILAPYLPTINSSNVGLQFGEFNWLDVFLNRTRKGSCPECDTDLIRIMLAREGHYSAGIIVCPNYARLVGDDSLGLPMRDEEHTTQYWMEIWGSEPPIKNLINYSRQLKEQPEGGLQGLQALAEVENNKRLFGLSDPRIKKCFFLEDVLGLKNERGFLPNKAIDELLTPVYVHQ